MRRRLATGGSGARRLFARGARGSTTFPTISSIDIDGDGPIAPYGGQGSICTVQGSGFGPGFKIQFDGVSVAGTLYIDSRTLVCTVPASVTAQPGPHDVSIDNGSGTASNFGEIEVIVVPYVVPGIVAWIDPTRYADTEYPAAQWTMVASMGRVLSPVGTSPPAMTVTGTPAFAPLNLRVEITTGGSLGAAIFKYSTDCGDTYTEGVTTAASVVLPGTGLTLGFAAGSYTLGDRYESDTRVDNVTSRESTTGVIDSTKTFTQSAVPARRPTFVRSSPEYGGRPCLRVAGLAADTILMDSGLWSTPLPTPLTFFLVGAIPGQNPAATNNYIQFCDTPSLGQIASGYSGASSASDPDRPIAAWGGTGVVGNNRPSATWFKDVPGIMAIVADGANAVMYAGGPSYANARAGVAWSQTLTQARLFNYAGGVVNTPHQTLGELLIFSGVLSMANLNLVGNYLASKFLLGWS